MKLLQETQCGQYSDNCQQCMNVRDANCGWCVTSNRYIHVLSRFWGEEIKNSPAYSRLMLLSKSIVMICKIVLQFHDLVVSFYVDVPQKWNV